MCHASIERINGEPVIHIDGQPITPMAMTTYLEKPAYLRKLGEAGIRLFFVMANTDWLDPPRHVVGDDGTERDEPGGFSKFCTDMTRLLENVPDAYVIVRIGLHPPVEWVEAHPDDIMRYSDGGTIPAIVQSEVHSQTLPGMYSLCSDAWREDAAKALKAFCERADQQWFGDRIAGYFLAAGGTSEWYYVTGLSDVACNRVADCSPAFQREFGRFLKEKYGDEASLRAAWGMPDASFAHPAIPSLEERAYTWVDEEIVQAMHLYESADRLVDQTVDDNPSHGTHLGVFLNDDVGRRVADFYQAWHAGTANSILYFADKLKTWYPHKLVGAFYGSYGCTNYFDLSTAGATLRILDSGLVDFLASPGVYNNREPGGYVAGRQMQDSFRLRGQFFIAEEDSRTHLENDFYRDGMRLYELDDALNTLKRDFARNICEDTFAWWFDQHLHGGRYEHEAFYRLFARQQQIARSACVRAGRKRSEIALIYDQESIHYVSQYTNAYMLDYYRTSDLGRIGAPVDYYFHNDMAREDMPDYKLYVMINLFCLTDAERESIRRKASRNGAVVVWLYAPGFINPGRERRMDNAHIEELTGMHVRRLDQTMSPRFRLIAEPHPALRLGDRDRLYGYIDRDVHSNVWPGPGELMAPHANPWFCIDDPEAEVLGRYCINGLPALAMKEQPPAGGGKRWTSVYCASHILRSELLASLALYAGCHLYNTDDDCLYAGAGFVTLHAAYTGRHTIRFPSSCNPYEVYEMRYYGRNSQSLELDLHKGETRMFCIDDDLTERLSS